MWAWSVKGLGGLVELMEGIAASGAVMAGEDVGEFGNQIDRLIKLCAREQTRNREEHPDIDPVSKGM